MLSFGNVTVGFPWATHDRPWEVPRSVMDFRKHEAQTWTDLFQVGLFLTLFKFQQLLYVYKWSFQNSIQLQIYRHYKIHILIQQTS